MGIKSPVFQLHQMTSIRFFFRLLLQGILLQERKSTWPIYLTLAEMKIYLLITAGEEKMDDLTELLRFYEFSFTHSFFFSMRNNKAKTMEIMCVL